MSDSFFEIVDCVPPGSCVHGIIQEKYWNVLSFSSPWDHPGPEVKCVSALSLEFAGTFFMAEPLGKPVFVVVVVFFWYSH